MSQFESTLRWLRRNAVTTFLFIAYVFLSILNYEQGRTIDNQRALIRSLFSDSLELSHKKTEELRGLYAHQH